MKIKDLKPGQEFILKRSGKKYTYIGVPEGKDKTFRVCRDQDGTEFALHSGSYVLIPSFYIGTIMELNGFFEYETPVLFVSADPEATLDEIACDWRGNDKDDYDDQYEGYWNDGTLIIPKCFDAIPEAHFHVLKQYVAVL